MSGAPSTTADRLRELEEERERLHEEIAGYPQPIPACDEHFNHLLEKRERVTKELVRLRARARAARSATPGPADGPAQRRDA